MANSSSNRRLFRKSINGKKCLIIGGGFGGIACALRCRAIGYQVTLIERLNNLGGRAQVFEIDGFKHDAGPTLITAPFLIEELFELFGENINNYIELKPITPWYRFVFHDGRTLDYGSDIEKLREEIASFLVDDVKGYDNLLKSSQSIYEVGFKKLAH